MKIFLNKKFIITICVLTVLSVSYAIIWPKIKSGITNKKQPYIYEAKVVNTKGALIRLSNGGIVQLAGAYIPLGGVNYRDYLVENIKDLLIGKAVRVKVISKPKNAYPNYLIAILYLEEGVNINEKLIKEGNALFDHGYYPRYKSFEKLEKLARKNKIGMWGSNNPPEVLFITSKYWKGIHLKNSPIAENIPEKDKIEYFAMPQQMWWGRFWDYDSEYGKEHDPHKQDFIDYYYKWYSNLYEPQK